MRAALREAGWLNGERARGYCRVLAGVMLAIGVVWVGLSRHGIDPTGKPLGTDFESFWVAARMAASGHAADVYRVGAHAAAERAAFAGVAGGYVAFFYPPVFLLICLPLGMLPYLWALALWLGATLLFYWRAMRAVWPQGGLALLAFPAVFIEIGSGQNALLTAALFATGMALLDRLPVVAGVALGCLVYKPQFLPVLPLVLLVAGRWRAVAGMALGAGLLVAASVAAFGPGVWGEFLANGRLATLTLEQGLMGFGKLQSLFAALRLFGVPVGAAFAAHGVLAAGVVAGLLLLARRRPDAAALLAPAAVGALLITPFVLDYDLLLLAPALGWAMREARARGFMPWEKIVLGAGFALPLVARLLATAHVPITPVVLLAVFWIMLRRAWATGAGEPAPASA